MNEKQTPLIDLLRAVPADACMTYEHSEHHHQMIPAGRLCHEAAEALSAVELNRPRVPDDSHLDEIVEDLRSVEDDDAADAITALRQRLAETDSTWVDETDTTWRSPTAWSYAMTCRALKDQRERAERAEADRDKALKESEALRASIETMRQAALIDDWETFDLAVNAAGGKA